ncbi:hypothetical protein ACHAWF_014270 [Thalassiosira exigua]
MADFRHAPDRESSRRDKGAAKSTAARGAARLLPRIEVGYDPTTGTIDAFNRPPLRREAELCDDANEDEEDPSFPFPRRSASRLIDAPFVDLPLGATEDRVLGSVDFSETLKNGGTPAFAPGLLASANRGVLYVDEFVLVGTMNEEEGELRPQLLDRFGLAVDVAAPDDHRVRCKVVRRRMSYERDEASFRDPRGRSNCPARSGRREIASRTSPSDACCCSRASSASWAWAASSLAAWEGRTEVDADDVRRASKWALAHRRRRRPFDSPGDEPDAGEVLDQMMKDDSRDSPSLQRPPSRERPSGGKDGGPGQRPNREEEPMYEDPATTDRDDLSSTEQDDKGDCDRNDDGGGKGQQMQTFTASMPGQIKRKRLPRASKQRPREGAIVRLSNPDCSRAGSRQRGRGRGRERGERRPPGALVPA